MTSTAGEVRSAADRLRAERRPFVSATVVRAERPTSARAGDSALVLDDGSIVGFVGGECAEASVQAQALMALETGEPVLLRIDPEAPEEPPANGAAGHGSGGHGSGGHGGGGGAGAHGADGGGAGAQAGGGHGAGGAVTVHNPCLSGGTLEIFLEPALPPPLVVVHGHAPIARALRSLIGWLGWDAQGVADAADAGDAGGRPEVPADADAVVVASHGGEEHPVLTAALRAGVPYVGLVASPRRGTAVLAALDVADDEKQRISTPAGFDIGARTPEEVALSILAEIVDRRPRVSRAAAGHEHHAAAVPAAGAAPAGSAATAVDPVCAMTVAAVESTRHADHEGVRYWFCGSGCEDAFRADPGAFLPS